MGYERLAELLRQSKLQEARNVIAEYTIKHGWHDALKLLNEAIKNEDFGWFLAKKKIFELFESNEISGLDRDMGYILNKIPNIKNFEKVCALISEHLLLALKEQFSNRKSTLFLDVDKLSKSKNAIIVKALAERRKNEFLSVIGNLGLIEGIKDCFEPDDLKVLATSSIGFELIRKGFIGSEKYADILQHITEVAMKLYNELNDEDSNHMKLYPPKLSKRLSSLLDHIIDFYANRPRSIKYFETSGLKSIEYLNEAGYYDADYIYKFLNIMTNPNESYSDRDNSIFSERTETWDHFVEALRWINEKQAIDYLESLLTRSPSYPVEGGVWYNVHDIALNVLEKTDSERIGKIACKFVLASEWERDEDYIWHNLTESSLDRAIRLAVENGYQKLIKNKLVAISSVCYKISNDDFDCAGVRGIAAKWLVKIDEELALENLIDKLMGIGLAANWFKRDIFEALLGVGKSNYPKIELALAHILSEFIGDEVNVFDIVDAMNEIAPSAIITFLDESEVSSYELIYIVKYTSVSLFLYFKLYQGYGYCFHDIDLEVLSNVVSLNSNILVSSLSSNIEHEWKGSAAYLYYHPNLDAKNHIISAFHQRKTEPVLMSAMTKIGTFQVLELVVDSIEEIISEKSLSICLQDFEFRIVLSHILDLVKDLKTKAIEFLSNRLRNDSIQIRSTSILLLSLIASKIEDHTFQEFNGLKELLDQLYNSDERELSDPDWFWELIHNGEEDKINLIESLVANNIDFWINES